MKLLRGLEDSVCSPNVTIDSLTSRKLMASVFVERSKLLLANKEPLMASYFLRCVLDMNFTEKNLDLNLTKKNESLHGTTVVSNNLKAFVNLENDFNSQNDALAFGNNEECTVDKDMEVMRLQIKSHNLLAKINLNSDGDQSFKHLKEVYLFIFLFFWGFLCF